MRTVLNLIKINVDKSSRWIGPVLDNERNLRIVLGLLTKIKWKELKDKITKLLVVIASCTF